MKKIIAISLICSLFIVGCSVEKRHYMTGYHFERNSSVSQIKSNNKQLTDEAPINLNASLSLEPLESQLSSMNLNAGNNLPKDTCVMLYRPGKDIMVRIVEIDDKVIKYIRCDSKDNKIEKIDKSVVDRYNKMAEESLNILKTEDSVRLAAFMPSKMAGKLYKKRYVCFIPFIGIVHCLYTIDRVKKTKRENLNNPDLLVEIEKLEKVKKLAIIALFTVQVIPAAFILLMVGLFGVYFMNEMSGT